MTVRDEDGGSPTTNDTDTTMREMDRSRPSVESFKNLDDAFGDELVEVPSPSLKSDKSSNDPLTAKRSTFVNKMKTIGNKQLKQTKQLPKKVSFEEDDAKFKAEVLNSSIPLDPLEKPPSFVLRHDDDMDSLDEEKGTLFREKTDDYDGDDDKDRKRIYGNRLSRSLPVSSTTAGQSDPPDRDNMPVILEALPPGLCSRPRSGSFGSFCSDISAPTTLLNPRMSSHRSMGLLSETPTVEHSDTLPDFSVESLSRRRPGGKGKSGSLKRLFRPTNNVVNEIKWPSINADVKTNREQVATRRLYYEIEPMSSKDRAVNLIKGKTPISSPPERGCRVRKQFHMMSRRKAPENSRVAKFFDRWGINIPWNRVSLSSDDYTESSDNNYYYYCCNWSRLIGEYIIWTFRTSFNTLFWTALAAYMFIVLIFTATFMMVGNRHPECFAGSGYSDFHDAFNLSWTTLTTVGYGYTSPENAKECGFLHFLSCAESFIGVLYAGTCAAVLFGKVTRIQSRAHITFSDPIVVQFGRALVSDGDPDILVNASPCPIMEFRVANRLYGVRGGEIMNAHIGCVAIRNDVSLSSEVRRQSLDGSASATVRRVHHKIDSDVDPLAPTKRVFAKVNILSSEHPYFKRVWNVKHVLNENSPLINDVTKRKIKENYGFWPGNLNTWQDVRNSIQFDQLVVTFEGVSNVSASTVYAQKVYEMVDVNVGFEYANMLYRSKTGIGMDLSILSDIIEQVGGGSEPMEE